ncbi:hypothetical protein NMD99_06295 [Wolbachia endosymbiont of Listronotus oregonensis]|nr:hypothetical protein NMD99_06295 [Wolbachia endosymbiont of Listronotus oregonensis]
MFKWNTNNIIDATGGRGVNGCNWTHSSNISTDTRSIKKVIYLLHSRERILMAIIFCMKRF